MPNPAPDVDMAPPPVPVGSSNPSQGLEVQFEDPDEPRKKKYAKEAWPGKKPTASLLV
jgi:nuclear inhibitor of protein phosphatase 1